MTTSWKTLSICVLSGLVVAVGTAWGQSGLNEPGVQQQETLQRQATAESIISRDEAVLGRKFDPQYRAALKAAIGSLSPSEVAAIPEGRSPLALGDTSADLVFTPVTPCRIINFQFIPGDTSQSFIVAGLCGIPFAEAKAVMINFISVNPSGPGDLRAFPYPLAAPLASVLNYAPVAGLNIANGIAVPICDATTATCSFDLTIQADVGGTTVVADVFGYFAAPVATALACVNTAVGTTTVGAGAIFSAIPPACAAGYTQVSVGCRSVAYNTANWAITGYFFAGTPALASCWGTNISAGSATFEAVGRCCRVPGR